MVNRSYTALVGNSQVKADGNELAALGRMYISDLNVLNRVSELFLFDVFVMDKIYGIDPHSVFGLIKDLENNVVTGVKPASQFRNIPLKGLWHQHYFSAAFVVENIRLGLGKNGAGNLIEEIFTRDSSPVITQEMINELSHRVVHDSLDARNAGNKLTGEWIIFLMHEGRRYFLCLSVHEAEDQSIYDKIVEHCVRDFPDLVDWINEARNSM